MLKNILFFVSHLLITTSASGTCCIILDIAIFRCNSLIFPFTCGSPSSCLYSSLKGIIKISILFYLLYDFIGKQIIELPKLFTLEIPAACGLFCMYEKYFSMQPFNAE